MIVQCGLCVVGGKETEDERGSLWLLHLEPLSSDA